MTEAKPPLSTAQIKALKAQAHHLSPVVMLGAAGMVASVMREIDVALTAHGLIKIKLGGESRADRQLLIEQICSETDSQIVQAIGKVGVFYREKPEPTSTQDKRHVPKQKAGERAIYRKPIPKPGPRRAKSARK